MPISVERRIESTAGSPVVGRFAVAADENLNPRRSWVWYTSPVTVFSVAFLFVFSGFFLEIRWRWD